MRSSRNVLDQLRLNLLKAQIDNARENIPFYREQFKRLNLSSIDLKTIDDLHKLPVITKEDVLNNRAGFIHKTFTPEACFHSFSSGSTGQPFESRFDKSCWLRKKYLSKLRARFACGMRPGERVAIFESESQPFLNRQNRNHGLRHLFLKVKYFSIFNDMEETFRRLSSFSPQNVYGPQSFFFQLALQINTRAQSLPSIKRIYTSSEYRESHIAEYIQKTFLAGVFDVYGSTEFKEVAWECNRHQGYHINEDEIICEILKGDNPAAPGEVGDIVLTDLRNHAMPLIRYRIHDRGKILSEQCPCGRTFSLMVPMAGRASEYVLLPDGKTIPPYRFTTAIEHFKGLIQYQLVQESATDILVRIILDKKNNNGTAAKIQSTVEGITLGKMRVRIRTTDRIPIEENGKFRVVKNLYQESPDIHGGEMKPMKG